MPPMPAKGVVALLTETDAEADEYDSSFSDSNNSLTDATE